jgi:sugar lactone lactonase YvrE
MRTSLAYGFLVFAPCWCQFTVNTIAGGRIRSGVPAKDVIVRGSIAQDAAGSIYVCNDALNVIQEITPDGTISTIAGDGVSAFSGEGGPAINAELHEPAYCSVDASGNLIFADLLNYRIRRIDLNGVISTIAGTGIQGPLGDGINATTMAIDLVNGMAADQSGNTYFVESNENRIRRVTPSGHIELVAGIAQPLGLAKSTGDNGPAIQAGLNVPAGLAIDAAGELFFMDDQYRRIRRIAKDGTITTIGGNGQQLCSTSKTGEGGLATAAALCPAALASDRPGNIYFVDSAPNLGRIRRIDSNGTLTTVGGAAQSGPTGDGPALSVYLNNPGNLFVDSKGIVWFQDGILFRQISGGNISTVWGGKPLHAPDGIAARDAWLLQPTAIAVSRGGDLYIAEGVDCAIRKVFPSGVLSTMPGTGTCSSGLTFVPQSIAVNSKGSIYASSSNSGQVVVIAPDGSVTPTPFMSGGELAIDSTDVVYLLSTLYGVTRLAPGGTTDLFVAPHGKYAVNLPSPQALCVDTSDTLYVVDSGRIYVITASGVFMSTLSIYPIGALAVDNSHNYWDLSPGLIAFGTNFRSMQGIGFRGDGGPLASARFNPGSNGGIVAGSDGSIYVNDGMNARVRKIGGALRRPQPPSPLQEL